MPVLALNIFTPSRKWLRLLHSKARMYRNSSCRGILRITHPGDLPTLPRLEFGPEPYALRETMGVVHE